MIRPPATLALIRRTAAIMMRSRAVCVLTRLRRPFCTYSPAASLVWCDEEEKGGEYFRESIDVVPYGSHGPLESYYGFRAVNELLFNTTSTATSIPISFRASKTGEIWRVAS